MSRLIKADLLRTLKRHTFYVWAVVIWIIAFFIGGFQNYAEEQIQSEMSSLRLMCPLIVSIPTFLIVYGSDVKTGTIQCVVGRGISRSKVVYAKFIESVLFIAFYYTILCTSLHIKNSIIEVGITATQTLSLSLYILTLFLCTVGYLAFSAFFFYLSWNTAVGIIGICFISMMLPPLFMAAQTHFKIPVSDMSYTGLLLKAYNDINIGSFPSTALVALIYLFAAVRITATVFERKEIEF